jgi:hypothetical protein
MTIPTTPDAAFLILSAATVIAAALGLGTWTLACAWDRPYPCETADTECAEPCVDPHDTALPVTKPSPCHPSAAFTECGRGEPAAGKSICDSCGHSWTCIEREDLTWAWRRTDAIECPDTDERGGGR